MYYLFYISPNIYSFGIIITILIHYVKYTKKKKKDSFSNYNYIKTKKETSAAGFEPARAEPTRFQV